MINRKKQPERFGRGELELPPQDRATPSVDDARNVFLFYVRKLAPKVLETLAEEPYRRFLETLRDSSPKWRWRNLEQNPPSEDSPLAKFRQSLIDWSHTHKLDVLWIREHACETLIWWATSPETYKERNWCLSFMYPSYALGSSTFKFEFETLYPALGFRAEIEKEIIESCRVKLNEFLKQREAEAQQSGYKKTKQKRNYSHFAWLVDHQVNELSYDQVIEKYQEAGSIDADSLSLGTVSDAITQTAELIDLPLRSAPRRRPRQ